VWRALKALGVASLRDGVYVVPKRPELADALAAQQRDITESGGTAYIFTLAGQSEREDADLRALFDRDAAYDVVAVAAEEVLPTLGKLKEVEARRVLRQLTRELAAIESIDYFIASGRGPREAGFGSTGSRAHG